MYFHFKPMTDNDAPGAPRALLASFVKRSTIRARCSHNTKALGLVVSKKICFYVFSHFKAMEAMAPHTVYILSYH